MTKKEIIDKLETLKEIANQKSINARENRSRESENYYLGYYAACSEALYSLRRMKE